MQQYVLEDLTDVFKTFPINTHIHKIEMPLVNKLPESCPTIYMDNREFFALYQILIASRLTSYLNHYHEIQVPFIGSLMARGTKNKISLFNQVGFSCDEIYCHCTLVFQHSYLHIRELASAFVVLA